MIIPNFYFWQKLPYSLIIGIIFLLTLSLGLLINGYKDFLYSKKLTIQKNHLEKIVAIKYQRLNDASVYQQQRRLVDAKLTDLKVKLIEPSSIPLLLETILLAARKSGVQIKTFERLTDINNIFYLQVPVKISLFGTYYNFSMFISRLISLNAIVKIDNFMLETTANKALLKMEIVINIYSSRAANANFYSAKKNFTLLPLSALPTLLDYHPQLYKLASTCTPFQRKTKKILGTIIFNQQRWSLILLPSGVIKQVKLPLSKNDNNL